MNVKKAVFLFLALLLPIVTFLFLKFFGKNEFSVEPLFQQEVQIPSDCKDIDYKFPYVIPDSVLSEIGIGDSLVLIVFSDSVITRQQEQTIQLTRIFREFRNDRLILVRASSARTEMKFDSGDIRGKVWHSDQYEVAKLMGCVFLLPKMNDAVVVDQNGRIMGQYSLMNREDADRLILELKIQLKKY